MIAPATIEEIRRLLARGGLSQRKIARKLGVSHGTVNAIALGRRSTRRQASRASAEDFASPQGAFVRCPECGGLVRMPCIACELRARRLCRKIVRRRA